MNRELRLGTLVLAMLGTLACTYDTDGDGYRDPPWGGGTVDCAPDDPDRFPGAPERCNGLDDNCDGVIDEIGLPYYADNDGDGFGAGDVLGYACEIAAPAGTSFLSDDCHDGDRLRTFDCSGRPDPDPEPDPDPGPEPLLLGTVSVAASLDADGRPLVERVSDLDGDGIAELLRVDPDGVLEWAPFADAGTSTGWTALLPLARWDAVPLTWAVWSANGDGATHLVLLAGPSADSTGETGTGMRVIGLDLVALADAGLDDAIAALDAYLAGPDESEGSGEGSGDTGGAPAADAPAWWESITSGVSEEAIVRAVGGGDGLVRVAAVEPAADASGGSRILDLARTASGEWLLDVVHELPDDTVNDVRLSGGIGSGWPGMLICSGSRPGLLAAERLPGGTSRVEAFGEAATTAPCVGFAASVPQGLLTVHGDPLPTTLVQHQTGGASVQVALAGVGTDAMLAVVVASQPIGTGELACHPAWITLQDGRSTGGCLMTGTPIVQIGRPVVLRGEQTDGTPEFAGDLSGDSVPDLIARTEGGPAWVAAPLQATFTPE